ncbi:single-stranded DNA-binding protein [Desulfovibrio ferrophilus]|uniref:Single-stranded DNA-binding protein n=1 Tax=Desulfovibrio ferrophilus TaxID=241368 RepID=A0A2Z6B3Z5_9BACT|nr:single-stranded DNA-binding protein [Desulfovibrio ferrophilus]BBD10133.1 single-stranded DNA-binding protein [Desulfovibrio ferrophilus]
MSEIIHIEGNVGGVRSNDVNGSKVCNVNIGCNRGKDKDGNERPTGWYTLEFWGEQASKVIEQGVDKGDFITADLYALRADAYATQDGKPAATLRARVSRYRLIKKNPTGA